jgi:hypothetical protein
MTTFELPAIPSELTWHTLPKHWKVEQERNLTITAGEITDLFTDPRGNFSINNAPKALFTPLSGNFVLSANVTVDFQATFDAGVLLLYDNGETWAKLCFEFSPQRQRWWSPSSIAAFLMIVIPSRLKEIRCIYALPELRRPSPFIIPPIVSSGIWYAILAWETCTI